ncbi:nucleoporin Nup37-like [Centruroides sculpturatus]|uniref:nucleoporin Nup37-like n=1 Tax=Centruroides sculpturatus TaxID=218467 RepID=UPI000C6D5412|nr:nucleoporin Nup37-like [Centruroides sculpturatus]
MDKRKNYVLNIHDVVTAIEFSPFGWVSSLLAVGTSTNVIIISCKFPEDDALVEDLEYKYIREFHHGCFVNCIAWSPQTTLTQIPHVLRFATVGGDKKIRFFHSDVKNEDTIQILEGHTDYINYISFEPQNGEEFASVSDDHTCRIWSVNGTLKFTFLLTSPGVFVSWHPDELPGKLMVAEKKGIIRFYNINKQQPMMSLDCNLTPLMSADWCTTNSLQVGCVAATDLLLWNISLSSQPVNKKLAHNKGALCFSFSRINLNVMATRGRPGNEIKVMNAKLNQIILSENLPAGQGISWHCKLPILAAGGDRKVHIWKIDST